MWLGFKLGFGLPLRDYQRTPTVSERLVSIPSQLSRQTVKFLELRTAEVIPVEADPRRLVANFNIRSQLPATK